MKNKNHECRIFSDGELIEKDTRRLKKSSSSDANISELEIYSIDYTDSGVYQCRKNSRVLKNIYLQVSKSNYFVHFRV
jgi:hypothetical protein